MLNHPHIPDERVEPERPRCGCAKDCGMIRALGSAAVNLKVIAHHKIGACADISWMKMRFLPTVRHLY